VARVSNTPEPSAVKNWPVTGELVSLAGVGIQLMVAVFEPKVGEQHQPVAVPDTVSVPEFLP